MYTTQHNITDGLRKFLRLQSLPLQEYQLRQNADVFDLMEALTMARDFYADTGRMLGKQMHQNQPYNHAEDVKRELEENLLVGKTERETAHLRKKNLTMYHLVLEPLVDSVGTSDHAEAIQLSGIAIERILQDIVAFSEYGTEDDALVAKHQIKAMVKQREEARRAQKEAAKKAGRRRKREEEIEVADEEDPTDD